MLIILDTCEHVVDACALFAAATAGVAAHVLDTPPAIQGDPPSPLALPPGCRFRSRCPIPQPRCVTEDPTPTTAPADPSHQAACHYAFTTVGFPGAV
jgi:peptide/nickel transport system ATP-binding protein